MNPATAARPTLPAKALPIRLATILSAAMMLRFSLNQEAAAQRIEAAVQSVLAARPANRRHLQRWHHPRVNTREMGNAVVKAL
jgi:3-isopropylmalate dehydrogenase